uniref:Uncharacterized protein n=1 Tax=Vespula pensylvanica TaxID=30213 RepID=A0A834P5H9_VESPE|nr:hypothetical protein H0235_005761 [Vespula pensylvanica]
MSNIPEGKGISIVGVETFKKNSPFSMKPVVLMLGNLPRVYKVYMLLQTSTKVHSSSKAKSLRRENLVQNESPSNVAPVNITLLYIRCQTYVVSDNNVGARIGGTSSSRMKILGWQPNSRFVESRQVEGRQYGKGSPPLFVLVLPGSLADAPRGEDNGLEGESIITAFSRFGPWLCIYSENFERTNTQSQTKEVIYMTIRQAEFGLETKAFVNTAT